MSDILLERRLQAPVGGKTARPLSRGVGLTIGLGVSLAMWAGLAVLLAALV